MQSVLAMGDIDQPLERRPSKLKGAFPEPAKEIPRTEPKEEFEPTLLSKILVCCGVLSVLVVLEVFVMLVVEPVLDEVAGVISPLHSRNFEPFVLV